MDKDITFMTSGELALSIARQVAQHRISLNYKQRDFAKKIGIPLRTYERFENTGLISFVNLLTILAAIGKKDILSNALEVDEVEEMGIEAFMEQDEVKKRQRVRSQRKK